MAFVDQRKHVLQYISTLQGTKDLKTYLALLLPISFPNTEIEQQILENIKSAVKPCLDLLSSDSYVTSFATQNFGMSILPKPILTLILQGLHTTNLFVVSRVNKEFHNTIFDAKSKCFQSTCLRDARSVYIEFLPRPHVKLTDESPITIKDDFITIQFCENHDHECRASELAEIHRAKNALGYGSNDSLAFEEVPSLKIGKDFLPLANHIDFYESESCSKEFFEFLSEYDGSFRACSLRSLDVPRSMEQVTHDRFPNLCEIGFGDWVLRSGRDKNFPHESIWLQLNRVGTFWLPVMFIDDVPFSQMTMLIDLMDMISCLMNVQNISVSFYETAIEGEIFPLQDFEVKDEWIENRGRRTFEVEIHLHENDANREKILERVLLRVWEPLAPKKHVWF